MSTENPLLSYIELVNEIKTFCDNMISGTLLIATETNLLIRMILDEGNITAMICGTRHGMDVIPDLLGITAGRLKFSASKMGSNKGEELPATQEILRQLLSKAGATQKKTTPAINISAETTGGNVGSGQVAAVLNIMEKELIEFLGPMASIVWEEHMARMEQPIDSAGLKTLMNVLGNEIGDTEKVNTFKNRIREKVNNL